ncbi:MAG TPA: hypothetical protein DD490_26020 [Acidobacteria bacterium]|nr:hypothetical protein [Acidobacteriota bacterium]
MNPNTTIDPHRLGLDPGQGGDESSLPMYRLDDDMVKLVPYTIVSVQRDAERVMPGGSGQIVVSENMTGEAFKTFLIARYLSSEDYRKLDPDEKLAPRDEKYLRVHYAVARRWPRESRAFEKRQLAGLEGIRSVLEDITKGVVPDQKGSR